MYSKYTMLNKCSNSSRNNSDWQSVFLSFIVFSAAMVVVVVCYAIHLDAITLEDLIHAWALLTPKVQFISQVWLLCTVSSAVRLTLPTEEVARVRYTCSLIANRDGAWNS